MQAITVEEIVARLRTLRRGKMFIATFITECNAQDMIPVVHGEWISAKVGRLFPSNDYKCSNCGNILDFDGVNCGRGDANFCPNCGADMRKEQT